MRTTVMKDDYGLFSGPPGHQAFSSLEYAVLPAGSDPMRIVIASDLTVSGDLTVPDNITLEFTQGGRLTVAGGCTLTILGHVYAPAQRIFYGSGNTMFAADDCVIFPGWWGTGGGVRIGKLESADVEVVNLTATDLIADGAEVADIQAGTVHASGEIVSEGIVRAVEVYEGSARVGFDRVARAGDQMTGPLLLAGPPMIPAEAANRGFVEELFANLQIQVSQTNSFGILLYGDGTGKIEAVRPLDVMGFLNGFGITITEGAGLKLTDGPAAFHLSDAIAVKISDENRLVVAADEPPASVTLAAGDAVPTSARTVRVSGDGGAVDLTSSPQVNNGQFDGQQLFIVGDSDSNTVTLDHGDGLALVGGAAMTLGEGDCLALRWDNSASLWREMHRANV